MQSLNDAAYSIVGWTLIVATVAILALTVHFLAEHIRQNKCSEYMLGPVVGDTTILWKQCELPRIKS